MRVETKNVYTFKELIEDSKKNAIEKWRDSETFDFIGFDYNDYFDDTLRKNGFNIESEEFQYSLCNCQGDGLSFTCKDFNEYILFSSFIKDNPKMKRTLKIIENYCDYDFQIIRTNNQYVHEKSVYFEFTTTPTNKHYLDIAIDEFCELFTDFIEAIRLNICLKFESVLQKEIEYLLSEECIKETIELNEYEFYEDGSIF